MRGGLPLPVYLPKTSLIDSARADGLLHWAHSASSATRLPRSIPKRGDLSQTVFTWENL
ncbi:protein of unknown function [Paraburkholderia dioscoreae]|uniref:Uncharacterized protein n=1 Tax=Paraburkholderia dioscoreae TaxID=2604047 RepID=A0A5Q4ZIY0_9BURK|nr:protein of unknown function [Paraburkholderia dioscoreae]